MFPRPVSIHAAPSASRAPMASLRDGASATLDPPPRRARRPGRGSRGGVGLGAGRAISVRLPPVNPGHPVPVRTTVRPRSAAIEGLPGTLPNWDSHVTSGAASGPSDSGRAEKPGEPARMFPLLNTNSRLPRAQAFGGWGRAAL